MKTWKDISSIPLPATMQGLSKDKRGYVIPWSVVIKPDGTPDFRVIDTAKSRRALVYRLCHMCGTPHNDDMAFIGGPVSAKSHAYIDGPTHIDCAHYALQVCPFLAAPSFGYAKAVKAIPGFKMSTITEMAMTRPAMFVMGVSRTYEVEQVPSGSIIIAGSWVKTE